MAKKLWDPNKEDYEYVAGDKPGQGAMGGMKTTMQNAPFAEPQIRYKDVLIECELYKDPVSHKMMLHAMCPKCKHALRISEERKAMDWDGQTISVEPFECPWELDTELTVGTFTNLCRWRVGVSHGIAKDA